MIARRGNRRGAYLVITAVGVVVFLGFAALVVDVGLQRTVSSELQVALDAAATAAAPRLDGKATGLVAARDEAILFAGENGVRTIGPVALDRNDANAPDGDIVLGIWDMAARTFTPSLDAAKVNAVQTHHHGTVPTLLAQITFGIKATGVTGTALAMREVGGAGAAACFLPLALPSCVFTDWEPGDVQDITFVLSPAGVDNVAWGGLGEHPSTSYVTDQISNCTHHGEASVGDEIVLDNGVATPSLRAIADAIDASADTWDASRFGPLPPRMAGSDVKHYGNVLSNPILVFDSDPSFCTTGGTFTGASTLRGFAWGAVYDVRSGGSAADKNLKMRIDRLGEHFVGTAGGGPDWGVGSAVRGVLVR